METFKSEEIKKILNGYHARYDDSFREKICIEHTHSYWTCEPSKWYVEQEKNFTPEEKQSAQKALTFYDAVHPYLSRTGQTIPFIFDCRRGAYASCIAQVNGGANDFNSADEQLKLCPSVMIALNFDLFRASLTGIKDGYHSANEESKLNYFSDKSSIGQQYNDTRVILNDLLYMYKKIKAHGINTKIVEEHQKIMDKEGKNVKIKDIFAQMDALLKIPEKERFCPKETTIQNIAKSQKRGFLSFLCFFKPNQHVNC